MKRAVLLAVVLALSCGVSFAGGPSNPGSASGTTPVSLTAIIPSYIGFSTPSVSSVTFDYSNFGSAVVTGLNITRNATGASPSWTLMYNLVNSPTVTVCAVAQPLVGQNSGTQISPAQIFAATQSSGSQAFQFNQTCAGQPNAILLDSIQHATSSTGTTESLVGMFMQTPNGTVLTPDTYVGSVNIIAQVQ